MKKTLLIALAVLTLGIAPIVAGNDNGGGGQGPGGGEPGPGGANGAVCGGLPNAVMELPFEEVSAAEQADLLWMREEEKLARDVYLAMDDVWGLRVFRNIALAEQGHMGAILTLLDKYEIEDPVGDNPPGVFSDPTLQQMFDDLFEQGSQSLIDALVVGATIEDVDIYDLDSSIAKADNLDILTVYQNLQKGSRNHLRSFVGLLEANDVTYEPQFLSLADFEAIVTSPKETGMLDADGERLDCGCPGRSGPGGRAANRHRHERVGEQQQQQQQQQSQQRQQQQQRLDP